MTTTPRVRRSVRTSCPSILILSLLLLTACTTTPTREAAAPQPTPDRSASPAAAGFVSARELASRKGLQVIRESDRRHLRLVGRGLNVHIDSQSRVTYVNEELVLLKEVPREWGNDLWVPAAFETRLRPKARPATARAPMKKPAPRKKWRGQATLGRGSLRGFHVVLDAGHGGKDPGAVAPSGLYEKTVALEITQEVKRLLVSAGARVTMTRDGDRFISLDGRVAVSTRVRPDVFVSIHANTAPNRRARGVEVFRPPQRSRGQQHDKVAASLRLARAVYKRMAAVSPAPDRGVKPDQRGFRVLKKNVYPCILIEVGFLTNRSDLALLTKRSHRMKIARAIALGMADYAIQARAPRS